MFNFTLYRREMKGLWKMLAIFAGVMTLYITVIISIYDPGMKSALEEFTAVMPEIMAAVGMVPGAPGLLGFLSSYLYGFVLAAFPMAFSILCGNKLIARYVDKGSMVSLLAAPVKRRTVAFTQMKAMITGIVALVLYTTLLEITVSEAGFPGELDIPKLLLMNVGLLSLHLFIGGICFFCSCLFSDTKYSIGFGAGIPALMYVLQMLSNTGGDAEWAKYLTFFTLFNPDKLAEGNGGAVAGMLILFCGAAVLFAASITVFSKKDLHI